MSNNKLKTDFYHAVNEQWLETTDIPGDQPAVSAFLELHLDIEKTLTELTEDWNNDPSELNDNLLKYIKLYRMTKDFDKRNALGTKPFDVILEKIESLNNLNDLEEAYETLSLESFTLPFGFSVMQDFKHSDNQILYFGGADLFLPDTSYYKDPKQKEQMIGLFTQTTTQLLKLYGFSDDKIEQLLKDALAFDEMLVPVTKSSVEKADYVKMYNPMTKADVEQRTTDINVMAIAESLVNEPVDQLIITHPAFIEAFDTIVTSDKFELIKAWMIVSNAIKFAPHLTNDIRIAGGAFRRALSGIKEPKSKEKFAFYQAYNRFDQVVGLYYGETYFGPVAKKDVEVMVHEMIDIYQERIDNNTWLKDATKEKAIIKLSTLSVHVGYPDELPPYYDKFDITGYDNGSDLVQEHLAMTRIVNEYKFSQYNTKPNKNIWGMPASMVNAYYNPSNNQIVFPAAILQEPYYSLEQSKSENYGGIGAVMAHEISHAFDNNGAKFDETGSLNNWWTDADLDAFDKKAKDMITLFDGVETGFGECNGKLTVSENIADSGGLRCALEASKKHDDHSYDEFFRNWARVWRIKASKEYSQLLLKVDVHGPSILRANMQLSNIEEFQVFYDISESDDMYLPKDKMVSIW